MITDVARMSNGKMIATVTGREKLLCGTRCKAKYSVYTNQDSNRVFRSLFREMIILLPLLIDMGSAMYGMSKRKNSLQQ